MWTRREMIQFGVGGTLATLAWPTSLRAAQQETGGKVVNDVHSKLNATRVDQVHRPQSTDALQQVIRAAGQKGQAIGVSGARHAMGGQQFARGGALIDIRGLNEVHRLDREAQAVDVGAGIQWPKLMNDLAAMQSDASEPLARIIHEAGSYVA